jgi:hypothetical protein
VDTIIAQETFDITVVCGLSATDRQERGQEWVRLLEDAEEVAELADGYALKFPDRESWIARAVELIVAERKCCPFFGFAITFAPDGGPIWLHVRGSGEAKALIEAFFVPAHLRATL